MSTAAIDFSSIGGKPVEQPEQKPGIDFSSIGGQRVGATAAVKAPSATETAVNTIGAGVTPAGMPSGAGTGFVKGAIDTLHEGVKIARSPLAMPVTGIPDQIARRLSPEFARREDAADASLSGATKLNGGAEMLGYGAEKGLELMVPAGEAAEAGARLKPSALFERSKAKFQQVMGAAADVPMQVTDELSKSLSRYQELVDAGGSRSLSVSKLLSRLTDPQKAPLTYKEARDFYSNISRLSADEFGRLTPIMKRQVGEIRSALNGAIAQTADHVGQMQPYLEAMGDYAKAMRMKDAFDELKALGWQATKYAVGSAIGGGIGGFLLRKGMDAAAQK